MANVAIRAILSHMETLKARIEVHTADAEKAIERRLIEREAANEAVRLRKIELADYHAATTWLDMEIERMGRL